MSLFNGVTEAAARKPDTVINGPGGFLNIQSSAVRSMSGKINQGSSLFDGVSPYGPLSVSDDVNYRTRPVKCQKICPEIMLPAFDGSQIKLSHAVASGDLCFTVRLSKVGKEKIIKNYNFFDKINLTPGLDILLGLPCVNYLLAGLCHFHTDSGAAGAVWIRFLGSMIGDYKRAETLMTRERDPILNAMRISKLVLMLVQEYIKPFGFCVGSDWQGGQTQGSADPNIGPVSYVTVVQIEGLAENIVNIWSKAGNTVNCGDDLTLALVPHKIDDQKKSHFVDKYTKEFDSVFRPMGATEMFVLNHWQYNTVKQKITFTERDIIYELLPLSSSTISKGAFPSWHVCRTQLMAKANTPGLQCYRDDGLMQKTGALLEVTIAPVFEYAHIADVLYHMFSKEEWTHLHKVSYPLDNFSKHNLLAKMRKKWRTTYHIRSQNLAVGNALVQQQAVPADLIQAHENVNAYASAITGIAGQTPDAFNMDSIFEKPPKAKRTKRIKFSENESVSDMVEM